MTKKLLIALTLGATSLMLASTAFAQKPRVQAVDDWPTMADVRFLVQDHGTGEDWEPVERGGVVRIAVGQTIRLRMQAVQQMRSKPEKYPSARFTLLTGKPRVTLSKADETVGRVLVTGNQVNAPGGKETWIRYELLRPVSPEKLMQGNIQVIVEDRKALLETPVETAAQQRGVTLYTDGDLRGYSQTFFEDVPDLRSTAMGQDRASSLAIDEGCQVYLYEGINYTGHYVIIDRTSPRLDTLGVRNDSTSSLKIVCFEEDERP